MNVLPAGERVAANLCCRPVSGDRLDYIRGSVSVLVSTCQYWA